MFFTKVKGFLWEPSKTFKLSREYTFNETIKYYITLLFIYAGLLILLFTSAFYLFGINQRWRMEGMLISEILLIFSVYFFIGLMLLISKFSVSLLGFPLIPFGITGIRSNSLTYVFILIFISLISIIIGILAIGTIIHAIVYLMGGKKGYVQTLKALMYGSTPALIFGWIPVLNIIAIIYSMAIQVIGIRHLQGITPIGAILAVFIPSAIVSFLIGILLLYMALPG